MKEIIIYLLKSSLWIGVFWMVYWLFLRKETFYKFNRFFLLFGLIASFALPFCIYKYTIILNPPQIAVTDSFGVAVPESPGFVISPWMVIILLHVVGALFLLFRHLKGALKLKKLILRNGFCRESGVKVVHTQDVDSTFSVFGYIFIDFSSCISEVERKLIYEHERAHINQCHWIDLMIVHAVCVVQWFNPFVWIYLNSMKQNHEFLADQEVLKHGNSPALYRAALINYTFKTPVFAFANAFAQYNKFKRIDMMKKENSNPKKKWAVLLLAPVLAVFLWAFAEPEYVFANNNKQLETVNFDFFFESVETESSVSGDTVINNITNIIVINTDKKAEIVLDSANIKVQNVEIQKDSVVVIGYGLQGEFDSIKNLNLKGSPISIRQISKKRMIPSGEDAEIANDSVVVFAYAKRHGGESPIERLIKSEGKPLLIVDGKELAMDFRNLKPDEIESISILKNPQSHVIYGNKGKNGVVVVSTKKQIKINSENNNQPILIVDGKESDVALSKLDPNQIESIDILKDQSAVQVYGDKAKNGVIQIKTKGSLNLQESLKGTIITTNGTYTSCSEDPVFIKRVKNLVDGNPLIIVDGVTFKDDIGDVKAEDIESINILKDAAATRLYGEKAKAGVILITTKEAAKKKKSN